MTMLLRVVDLKLAMGKLITSVDLFYFIFSFILYVKPITFFLAL